MRRAGEREGFTLIELLVVTVVVAMLMAVVFRLSGIVGETGERQKTVQKMQRLENCLSGYYAVFGSYPPVPLQGASRNIFRKTSSQNHMIQSDDPEDTDDSLATFKEYDSVKAACMSQPVAAMFPPPKTLRVEIAPRRYSESDSFPAYQTFLQQVQAALQADLYPASHKRNIEKWANRNLQDITRNTGMFNNYVGESDFNRLQLFRFGLMSFLLPRYRFMLDCARGSASGNAEAFNRVIDRFSQWTEMNPLPARMDSGIPYESWAAFCDIMGSDDDWQIDLIPSQAACARWISNLAGAFVSGRRMSIFGVPIGTARSNGIPDPGKAGSGSFSLYSPGGRNSSSSVGYPLQSLTVIDGWGNDLFYYSPQPFQTYVLWSAGANEKTFPPWVDIEEFKRKYPEHYDYAVEWMADDIKFMSTGGKK